MRTELSSKNCVTSPLTQASADWLKTRARTTLPSSRKCDSSCDDCANAIENYKSIVTIVRASKQALAGFSREPYGWNMARILHTISAGPGQDPMISMVIIDLCQAETWRPERKPFQVSNAKRPTKGLIGDMTF